MLLVSSKKSFTRSLVYHESFKARALAWYHSGHLLSGNWPFESQRKIIRTGPFMWIKKESSFFFKHGRTGGETVDTCLIALWQMWWLGCQLLYHWNISTMTGWIAIKFCTDIYGTKRFKPYWVWCDLGSSHSAPLRHFGLAAVCKFGRGLILKMCLFPEFSSTTTVGQSFN